MLCGLGSVGEEVQILMEGRGRLGCDVLIFKGGSEDGRIGPEAEVVLPGPLYPEEAHLAGSRKFYGVSGQSWGEKHLDAPGAGGPSPQTHLYRVQLMPPTK